VRDPQGRSGRRHDPAARRGGMHARVDHARESGGRARLAARSSSSCFSRGNRRCREPRSARSSSARRNARLPDRLRRGESSGRCSAPGEGSAVTGFVKRSDGRHTVWIDGGLSVRGRRPRSAGPARRARLRRRARNRSRSSASPRADFSIFPATRAALRCIDGA
jgi:hypothetical protein